jgi:adenosylmethionine-8-amino-7-oxononanoate aminotransferase
VIDRDDLLANVQAIGAQLRSELKLTFGDHPNVGDIRGRGLFIGMELVEDRDSRKPADRAISGRIKQAAMERGLVIYPGGGTADGHTGAHVLLAPPYIYDSSNVDELVTKLQLILKDVGLG